MPNIHLNVTIGSLLNFYKHERNIFGRCPNCDEPFRLSEVKLTYGKLPPKDVLSQLRRQRDTLQEQIDELEAKIEQAEYDHQDHIQTLTDKYEDKIDRLNDRWAYKVDNEVEKRIRSRITQIRRSAIARSRSGQLGKTLEKIAPMFPGFGHFPYDVRPIFDPVDFVIFDGYFHGDVTDIVFVEFKTGESRQNSIQKSIRRAIDKKQVYFEEKRLRRETIELLTRRNPPRCKCLSNKTQCVGYSV